MTASTKIHVFIDLENVQPPHNVELAKLRISSLLRGVETYLEEKGYCIDRVWACAKPRAPALTRNVIDAVFAEFGGTMQWTNQDVADNEIRQEIMRCFQLGLISSAILLISGDNDFAKVLISLRHAGIEVLVSGVNVGELLRRSADQVIELTAMA